MSIRDERERIARGGGGGAPVDLLTPTELLAIERAAQLWNQLTAIVGDGPTRARDLAELAAHIHAIQATVMAQAAARAYPEALRLLGDGGGLPAAEEDS